MKKAKILIAIVLAASTLSAQTILNGGIDVWNKRNTTLSLLDDFLYQLAPGDVLSVKIKGSANIAPRDEQRKGGGFLGLFKKTYNVRIDNWKEAGSTKIVVEIGEFGRVTLIADAAAKELTGEFTIPKDPDNLKVDLLTQCKITGYIDEYMTPLRAGRFEIMVTIISKARPDMLRTYFKSSEVQNLSILNFETDIRPFLENGKLIYKLPDETVKAVSDELKSKPNIRAIEKDLYKYLLNFSPNNTTLRAELSKVYLEELNFPEAQVQAKQTINTLSRKSSLTPKDQTDYAQAYEVLAGVSELREMGLQENAYTVGAIFYGEAAQWYKKAAANDGYTKATMNQVRCLQKAGTLNSLQQAADILIAFNNSFTP